MQPLIDLIQSGHHLTQEQVLQTVQCLTNPEIPETEKAQFLKLWRIRGETAAEITALVKELLERAVDPGVRPEELDGPLMDICGTGGDRLDLFNISTTAMFILAARGVVVAKHGNRGITSKSGSADVLEALGIPILNDAGAVRESLLRHRLAFLFAPNFHPAFKEIAPARRRLAAEGHATVFNMIGPLLNPTQPPFQLMGHFHSQMAEVAANVLAELGRKRAWVVHGRLAESQRGMDKISTLGMTEVHAVCGSERTDFLLNARDRFTGHTASHTSLQGSDAKENAALLVAILDGTEYGPKRDIVVANAAGALVVAEQANDFLEAVDMASETLNSGEAIRWLRKMQS